MDTPRLSHKGKIEEILGYVYRLIAMEPLATTQCLLSEHSYERGGKLSLVSCELVFGGDVSFLIRQGTPGTTSVTALP